MRNYSLDVLGQELTFRADADPERLEQARLMLENRFAILKEHGRHLSKEKLLTFLALALADDLIETQEERRDTEKKVRKIMTLIDDSTV